MSASDWTPERENTVRLRWAQGWTCSAIAKELGNGISRNAVIGKVTRLGLPGRKTPTRGVSKRTLIGKVRSTKGQCALAAKLPVQPKFKAEPFRSSRTPPKIGPRSVRHMDRFKYQCAMFCEGQEGATGFVCGEPTDGASAWCKSCERICYQPAQTKAAA